MSDSKNVKSGNVLKGKVALITGGASGIGRAITLMFARKGAAVSVMDIDRGEGQSVMQKITDTGGKAIFIPGDVSWSKDCHNAVRQTCEELGGLDILVNNAGVIRRAAVTETGEKEWDHVMAVNVKSVFLLSRYAIPVMAGAGGGVIINIASGWGLVGGCRAASYCASKGAVVQLTRAMAIDHGGQNIRVNCICPGDTDTDMIRSEAEQLGQPVEQFLDEAARRPLLRLGKPEDIAGAALFLSSDASSFVTGAVLVVDGGGLAG